VAGGTGATNVSFALCDPSPVRLRRLLAAYCAAQVVSDNEAFPSPLAPSLPEAARAAMGVEPGSPDLAALT
jgi:hypothetical protein